MKKLISILLVSLLLLSCVWVGAAGADINGLSYPSIYIKGKMEAIYNDIGTEDEWMVSDSSRVFSKEVTDVKAYATKKAEELAPEFAAAMLTGNYDLWAEDMSTLLEPIYRDFVLDKNGKPRENSGVKFDYSNLPSAAGRQTFGINDYYFQHDWRLSPLDTSDELAKYIDAVLAATGRTKVNLISRCEGCCIVLALLYRHPEYKSKIANNVMLGSSANGVVYCSNIFAGRYDLNADAINRYVGRNFDTDSDKAFGEDLFSDDEALRTFLKETISMISVTHMIDLPGDKLVELVDKVAPMIYPSLMMSSYGTCPSYWAMVRDDDYEQAKKLCGLVDENGTPVEEWANFVALIDEYHYNVQNESKNLLKGLETDLGITTMLVVKYGSETLPFIADCNELSDDTTLVKDASYGATTAKIGETLTEAQKAGAEPEYISPDNLINAKTGLFPETTWYFKYVGHTTWDGPIDDLINAYLGSNGTLRIGDENAPARFRLKDKETETVVEMNEENANQQSDYYQTDKVKSIFSFLTVFFPMLRRLIDLIKSKLGK